MQLRCFGKSCMQLGTAAEGGNGIARNGDSAFFYPVDVTPAGQQVSAGNDIISLLVFSFHGVLSLPDRTG